MTHSEIAPPVHMSVRVLSEREYLNEAKKFAFGSLECCADLSALQHDDLKDARQRAIAKADREYRTILTVRKRLLAEGLGTIYRGLWIQAGFMGSRIWVPALGRMAFFDLDSNHDRRRLDAAIDEFFAQRGRC